MATEQLSEQLRLVMERQGAMENALMQERQARAEAEQRLSVALGEVGGRADAAVATASVGASSTPVGVSSSSMMSCIDTRLLGKRDKFDGQDSCWFITKAYSGAPGYPHAAGESGGDERRCSERCLECLRAPDFVKAGILINGLQEEPLRRHMVLHTS